MQSMIPRVATAVSNDLSSSEPLVRMGSVELLEAAAQSEEILVEFAAAISHISSVLPSMPTATQVAALGVLEVSAGSNSHDLVKAVADTCQSFTQALFSPETTVQIAVLEVLEAGLGTKSKELYRAVTAVFPVLAGIISFGKPDVQVAARRVFEAGTRSFALNLLSTDSPLSRHSSRRDNQSVTSTHSSSSSSSRNIRSNAHPAVESAVTRLLVAIKQLLESLTQWSQRKMDEEQVSDVYVRFGNDFNAAVAAFAAFNIDMTDLMSVPEDLRDILETCLAEEATPDNLNVFLPKVRQIITNLLQGLRGKQSMYRRIVSEHQEQHRPSHSRTDSHTSKSEKSPRRDDGSRHRSQLLRSTIEEGGDDRDKAARQSTRSSGRRQDKRAQTPPPTSPPPVFREPDDEIPSNEKTTTITSGANG
ncbi:hypothetical protein M405DRAFT_626472 [Rhizopogon salebrosus TDB-379]|nr:hypothetical protein M405DRAFT_626472 [Rhizopogon salebrosus TDB-379]